MKASFYDVSINHNIVVLACERGHLDIVKLLIEKGADVNKEGSNGWIALQHGNNIVNLNERVSMTFS